MVSKSQEELEQPAKVYQLNSVETKVDAMNLKLDTLLTQTSTFVSQSQLQEILNERDKKIHLVYGPMKRNLTWFIRTSIVEALAIAGQGVIIFLSIIGN